MLFGLEQPIKGCKAAETGFHGNLHDGKLGMNQQLLSFHKPPVYQIIITGDVHDLLEKAGKVKFAEAGNICDIIELKVFGAVFVDVIANIEEKVNVLQMF